MPCLSPPPYLGPPQGESDAGQGRPGIFPHEMGNFSACYATHSEKTQGSYPEGGIAFEKTTKKAK